MPWTEEQRAALSKKRGQAAAQINNPDQRQKFIQAQGALEQKHKGNVPDEEYERLQKEADDTAGTGGLNMDMAIPQYKKGTDFVPKTGLAMLHRGEKVTPAKKNKKKWISSAIKHPGSLRRAAKKSGKSTHAFAESHKHSSGKVGQRSRLALTLGKLHHG